MTLESQAAMFAAMLYGLSPIDPFLLLLGALIVDAVFGDMGAIYSRVPHPVAALGRLVDGLDRRLNRPERTDATRRARGVLVVALVVALAVAAGAGLAWFARAVALGWLIELFFVATLLAQRSLYEHVVAVARAIERDGLEGGRRAVAHIVGREPESLDVHGVCRAAIESLAENFADGVVAPVFWYLVGGLPALFACKAINTLDSMIGHLSPRHRAFGWAAARLDTAMNFVPARLAAAFIALGAAFMPLASAGAAFDTMRRFARLHRSVNAGWPEGAMAGALGLALAGPRRYADHTVDDPWIGEGRRQATTFDVRRALAVFVFACLVQATMAALTRLIVAG